MQPTIKVLAPKVGETTSDRSFTGRRDAFHVPGILAYSAEALYAGEHVVFFNTELTTVRAVSDGGDGIVDPFVTGRIAPGTLVWILLKPGTVENLVHYFEVNIQPQKEEIQDDSCAGCYGYDDDEDDQLFDSCKGCYE